MSTVLSFSTDVDLVVRLDRFLAEGRSRRSSGTEPEFSKSRSSFITHAVRLLLDSVDSSARPSSPLALEEVPAAEAAPKPSLRDRILAELAQRPDVWTHVNILRAKFQDVTFRELKNALILLEDSGEIQGEHQRLPAQPMPHQRAGMHYTLPPS